MSKDPEFGSFGRYVETPVDQMSPEMRDAYDFTMELRGQVPGPHKIWLANPKLSKTIVPTGKVLPDGVFANKNANRDRHERHQRPLACGLFKLRAREDRRRARSPTGSQHAGLNCRSADLV